MTSVGVDILFPANDVNTASSWVELDLSGCPTPLSYLQNGTGKGNLPVPMDILALQFWMEQDICWWKWTTTIWLQGVGLWHNYWNSSGKTHLLVMYHLFSFQVWEPDIDTLAWKWSDGLIVEEHVCLCKVKEKSRLGFSYTIINLRCSMHSRSYFVMKCNIKLHILVVHFPLKASPVSISWRGSICCNRLWFTCGRHIGVERHNINDSEQ